MAALTGKQARIKITASVATTAAGEAFTAVASTTDVTVYRITDTAKRHWDRTVPPGVSVGATTQAPAAFSVNYVQGSVIFAAAQTTSAVVTADVSYLAASYLANAVGWDVDVNTDMLDVTTLSTTTGDVQWREFGVGLSAAGVTLNRITKADSTGMAFYDRGNAGQDMILELITQGTNKFEGYAHLETDTFAATVDALSNEDVALQVDSQLYFSTI